MKAGFAPMLLVGLMLVSGHSFEAPFQKHTYLNHLDSVSSIINDETEVLKIVIEEGNTHTKNIQRVISIKIVENIIDYFSMFGIRIIEDFSPDSEYMIKNRGFYHTVSHKKLQNNVYLLVGRLINAINESMDEEDYEQIRQFEIEDYSDNLCSEILGRTER